MNNVLKDIDHLVLDILDEVLDDEVSFSQTFR